MTETAPNHMNPNVKQDPFGRHQGADSQGVVQTISTTANAQRLSDTHGHKVTQDCQSCGIDALNHFRYSRPQQNLSVTWRPIKFFYFFTTLDDPLIHTTTDRARPIQNMGTLFALMRTRNISWHFLPLTTGLKITISQSSIHSQYLAITDMADRTSLSDLMTVDCESHIDVHHLTRLGVGQILSGRPHGSPTRCTLHGCYGSAETTATIEKASAC